MYTSDPHTPLSEYIKKLNAFRQEAGTLKTPYRIFATEMGPVTLDVLRRYADLGVTDFATSRANIYAIEEDMQPLQEKLDDLRRFADTIIAKF